MNTKRCPICTVELISGEHKRYETLSDHVCNPNGDLPERETYVCRNTGCDAYWDQLFWDYEGHGPYNSDFGQSYKYIDGNPCVIPSFSRKLYAEIYDKSQDSTILRTKRLLIKRKARRVADEYGNILEQSYSHDFYYGSGRGSYCLWIPGYRMLLYCIRGFTAIVGCIIATRKVADCRGPIKSSTTSESFHEMNGGGKPLASGLGCFMASC